MTTFLGLLTVYARRLSGAWLVVALGVPAIAQMDPPTAPPPFVEIPGVQELSGNLIARPLQPADAALYGLTEEEVELRRAMALGKLGLFPIVDVIAETDETIIGVGRGLETAVATMLMADGEFQYIEPDWLLHPLVAPNDIGYSSQWHHDSIYIDSEAGWDIETGDPSIVVAICDTGLRLTHDDLQLYRVEGYNAVDELWETNGGSVTAMNQHGTLVTGAAAANGDNVEGVAGMGWQLGHRMVRVSNMFSGAAFMSDITHGAITAANAGDKVVNISYSGSTTATAQTTGAYIRSQGAILVWASGNDSQLMTGDREDDVIVVGATRVGDLLASFSNFGPFVDLVAPGKDILTTDAEQDDDYDWVDGTSFAAPLVAGVCGLLYSANPNLTPAQVEFFLRAGCDDLGAAGTDDMFGYGRIDLGQTLLPFLCPGDIVGRVFRDQNADCFWNTGELTLAGWTVELVDPWGNTMLTDTTDGQGWYSFFNLPNANYTVKFEAPFGGWAPDCESDFSLDVTLGCFSLFGDFAVKPTWDQYFRVPSPRVPRPDH